MSTGASASSPAAKKGAGRQGSTVSSAPTSAAPPRSVSFVTVGASGYSQLFATNCFPPLFLAAVASELTHHVAQRLQSNLAALHTQRQQHMAVQPLTQSAEADGGEQSAEKQQLSATETAFEQQWQAEQQQLSERQLQLEAALEALSHTTDEQCVFDVRDGSSGTAVKLFEQKEARVKDVLTGAGKYELLVARKKADSPSLTFHPLQLPV